MPALVLAIPAAVMLAWVALKGRLPRREDVRSLVPGFAGEPLAPGETGELRQEEDPWKREELPYDRPSASGGEIGGPYGPGSQEQSPSGDGAGGGSLALGPTSAAKVLVGSGPDTTYYGGAVGAGPTQGAVGGSQPGAVAGGGTTTKPSAGAVGAAPRPAPVSTTPIVVGGGGRGVIAV